MENTPISGFTWKEWAHIRKTKLSYIFQGLELFDNLTGLENILLKNAITGYKTKEEITEMASRLGIEEFLHRKAGILSFGQQQRVAIVRALCQPFHYLLADECFSHIDLENSLKAYTLILEECKAQEAGLILTSLHETELPNVDERLEL